MAAEAIDSILFQRYGGHRRAAEGQQQDRDIIHAPWTRDSNAVPAGIWAFDMGGLPGRWGFVDAEYVLDDREGSEVGYVAAGMTGPTIHLS